jgi:hypothetical protein
MNDTMIRLSQERAAQAHLKLAKRNVESGDTILGGAGELYERAAEFYRSATEHMAKAQEKGASQRRIANYLGKSPGWVNRLLRWRASGYRNTPFGPQSKASRERARVQAAERTKRTQRARGKGEHDEVTAELARTKAVQAEAARARAEAERATDDAMRAKVEAIRERIWAERAYAKARAAGERFDAFDRPIDAATRNLLVKALGMLGSAHAGERASAAAVAEKQRARIGMTWDELLVPANDCQATEKESCSDEVVA